MHLSGVHVHRMLLDSKGNIPLWLDVCTSANVVFGGENEFVVEHPLRFVVQDCRRVQLDHLVVLYSQVMTRALQMSHLGGGLKKHKTEPGIKNAAKAQPLVHHVTS